MLNGLDLFSGIGGLSLALSEWVRPIAYCENDSYAQAVKLSRMASGDIPFAPIWNDVTTLEGKQFKGYCDIIYGGFPCQDISVAGTGDGLAGKRSGLFFEIIRLCRDIRPRFVFLENVPAITVRGLDRVLLEFTSLGFDCRWTIVSAAEFGAPHLRERWFLLAYAGDSGQWEFFQQEQEFGIDTETDTGSDGEIQSMANTNGKRLEGPRRSESEQYGSTESGWWATEPDVGRVVNGLPHRVDRIRGLGNAVVPRQAKEAFMRLSGIGGAP